jgi:hypothetical protein
MSTNKILVLGAVTVVTLGVVSAAGFFGIKVLAAAVSNGNYPSIITNLAKTFNVDESKVAQVFTDTRTQQETARLDRAVTDKEITAAQKDLIIAKRTEIQNKQAAIDAKSLTAEQRRTEMDTLRTEIQTWATSNNIPVRFVLGGGRDNFNGNGIRGGMMGGSRGAK